MSFFWTLGLWKEWLLVNGLLLAVYFVWDHFFCYSRETLADVRRDEALVRPLQVFGWKLHVPLLYGLEAAFFVDGGGLYLLQCDSQCRRDKGISDAAVTFENFRRSAGLGLRYNTPVGPIALDYGIKLDRRDGESFGRLHFSIGTIF